MNDVLLVVVIVVALGFDFTNGFHDTANAIATSVSTRALTPRLAVLVASVANLAGAFATTAVATTIGQGIVAAGPDQHQDHSRRAARRYRLESPHLVVRASLELLARPDWRPRRRRARPVRRAGGSVARARAQHRHPCSDRARARIRCRFRVAGRHLLGVPEIDPRRRQPRISPGAAGVRNIRRVHAWFERRAEDDGRDRTRTVRQREPRRRSRFPPG